MSEYDDRVRDLKLMIAECSTLRDAQNPQGRHYQRFQDRIDNATDQLELWETAVPELEKLDKAILSARADLAAAKDGMVRDDGVWVDQGSWSTVSTVAGVIGVSALLAGITFDVGWIVWAICIVALVVAVGSVFLSLAVRRDTWDEQQRCGDALEELLARRKKLLPGD